VVQLSNASAVHPVIIGAALVASCFACGVRATDLTGTRFSPDETIPRLTWQSLDVPAVGSVSDFVLASGRLYLLDGPARRVVIVEQQESGIWRKTGYLGESGNGPGELTEPTSITALETGEIAIVERRGKLHRFDRQGTHLGSTQLRLPCSPSYLQVVSSADSTLYLAANCIGESGDTLYAVLSWSRDGIAFEELAREARMATDGSAGTIYLPTRSLTGGTRDLLFGVGTTNCLILATPAAARPTTTRRCDVAAPALTASPPPDFERRLRRKRQNGRSMGVAYEWPTPLPSYFDKVVTPHGTVLLRPYHADSLLLQLTQHAAQSPTSAPFTPILIASLHDLVGCNREGCLWFDVTEQGARLSLVKVEEIESLLSASTSVGTMHRNIVR
jgi:hypothetical protein